MSSKIEIGRTYFTSNGEFITPVEEKDYRGTYYCAITTFDEEDKEHTQYKYLLPADILR